MIQVDLDHCTGCGACVDACPHGAIVLTHGRPAFDETLCADCGACVSACPTGALTEKTAVLVAPVSRLAAVPDRVPARPAGQVATRGVPARVLSGMLALAGYAVREVLPYALDFVAARRNASTISAGTARAAGAGRTAAGGGSRSRRRARRGRA